MSTTRLSAPDYVEKVVTDLMRSHSQLMKGVAHIANVDYALLNDAPLAGRKLIEEIRLGELQIARWAPPADDDEDLEETFG